MVDVRSHENTSKVHRMMLVMQQNLCTYLPATAATAIFPWTKWSSRVVG